MNDYPLPEEWIRNSLQAGIVIPAHPLALTDDRKLDERRQQGLTRYYHQAGAKGVAVGVHTTQFEIRQHGLYKPVLKLAIETIKDYDEKADRKTICIAGVIGDTSQAVEEAVFAREAGYSAGLLSLGALKTASKDELMHHCQAVAHEIPLVGFYLQPAAGGRLLPYEFWIEFVRIPNVVAIKIAAFNRYQTVDVVRAVAESGRSEEISLLTGNDDHILLDLIGDYSFGNLYKGIPLRFQGGLLGHWACWTQKAVYLVDSIEKIREEGAISQEMLVLANQITDANAAIFDAANNFAGCIPGIHEVLRRQGLMANNYCLDPSIGLSKGQEGEIDRVLRSYPHLVDDDFVKENLDIWLS